MVSCKAADFWLVIPMEALNGRQQRLAGLARAVRAAVVVPSLFALALLVIRQPEVAGFAVFGTFAHLVMVDYDLPGEPGLPSLQCSPCWVRSW